MTAVVQFCVLLIIALWHNGYGLNVDRDVCRSLYTHCKRVSYDHCIRSQDFNYCSQSEDFVRDIISAYNSDDAISPVGQPKPWPYFPRNAVGPYRQKAHKDVRGQEKADRFRHERDTERRNAQKSGDVLLRIIRKLYKDREESPAKLKQFERSSYEDDLDVRRKRDMLVAALNDRKQVIRRDNSNNRDLRIQFTYNDPEENEEREQKRTREREGYVFSPYGVGSQDADGRERDYGRSDNEYGRKEKDFNAYNSQQVQRGNMFSSDSNVDVQSGGETQQGDVREEKDSAAPLDVDTQARETVGQQSGESVGRKASGDNNEELEEQRRILQNGFEAQHKKKDLIFVEVEGNDDIHIIAKSEDQGNTDQDQGHLVLHVKNKVNNTAAREFANKLQNIIWGIKASEHVVFPQLSAHGAIITLHMVTNHAWFKPRENAKDVATQLNKDNALRLKIKKETGIEIESAESRGAAVYHHPVDANIADWDQFALVTAIVGGCTLGIIAAAVVVCCIKRRRRKGSLVDLKKQEAISDYQELLRTQMSINSAESPRSLKATFDQQRHGLVNGQGKVMRRTWGEEPQRFNMDISTGHVVLAYMEDHLKNEDRLNKEWEVLCRYEADPKDTTAGSDPNNARKNRYADVLPFDHSRVKLKETVNLLNSDYVNANFITDVDPHNPAYIATQGPLENTVADFWQMVWEQGVVVIVNLTRLSDMGMSQCNRYWPEDGCEAYHIYEVHLISEHIWCDDYLVRSFYLKNIQTSETRTVTQFHFLTWPDLSVPDSPKALLEFRRKVNKCYRGQSCPIIVHCNDGVGRTGTYILVDLVLNSMMKGAKEIDIAATLEHLRDQRPDMVKAKAQFEFALAAVAEEVTAILTSLPP